MRGSLPFFHVFILSIFPFVFVFIYFLSFKKDFHFCQVFLFRIFYFLLFFIFSICFNFSFVRFFIFSILPCPSPQSSSLLRALLKHRLFLNKSQLQSTILGGRRRKKEEERRKKKKEERADQNRSPSTIARTGNCCHPRARKPLTPIKGFLLQHRGTVCRTGKSIQHRFPSTRSATECST